MNRFTFIEIKNYTSTTYNISVIQACVTPQTFISFAEFVQCYKFFFSHSFLVSILEILLILSTVFFNLLLILLIYFKPRLRREKHLTCFDKIYIGQAFVDGITGLLDVPLFHIENIFDYWPLGKSLGIYAACLDNTLNTIASLHMFYMSYVRMRSLLSPHTFYNERLIRSPTKSMLSIWLFGALVWVPLSMSYGTVRFSTHLNIESNFWFFSLYFMFWFVPVVSVLVIALWIINRMYKRNKQVIPSKIFVKKKKTFLSRFVIESSVGKFIVIISIYWMQWAPPCFLTVFSPIISYKIPESMTKVIYWLTFTVCLSDPIVVLLVNSNIRFCQKNPHSP